VLDGEAVNGIKVRVARCQCQVMLHGEGGNP